MAGVPERIVQDDVLRESLQNPEEFWLSQADRLFWHTKPKVALQKGRKALENGISHPTWDWFSGGEISTCYNCVDRHVAAGNGDTVAIYYHSPVTHVKEKYTYNNLLREVEALAGALRRYGIRRGDVVMLYMPMIPASIIGMLAINRLGAIHSVVFGGFAPTALAQRIDDCRPKILLTASCGIVGNRPAIAYQPLVEKAIRLSSHKPENVWIWQRPQLRWTTKPWWSRVWSFFRRIIGLQTSTKQSVWQNVVQRAKNDRLKAACVPIGSSEPVYILYTSGTTGTPKGVLRDAGGHAVGLSLSIASVFNIQGPGDVIFTASDIGWVVGHSYICYAPLLAGASTVLYEGKPVGTPDASAFWRVVKEYGVTTMFTAPTALRAIRNDDPENTMLEHIGKMGGLKQLRALFLAGERSEPSLIETYQHLLEKHAAPNARCIDNWWSTEVGSPITGGALMPNLALELPEMDPSSYALVSSKPGSAGKPMPGFDVRVVDDAGEEIERGAMGNVVLGLPLAPTAFHNLWNNDERFYRSYLERFNGRWMDTGDNGWIDKDGYVWVMGRNDDVLNVSAYRLSSGSIEQAVISHPLVIEACVVGIPDALKGQLPFAFITLSTSSYHSSPIPPSEIYREIQKLVREQVGAFASLGGIIQGSGTIPKTRSGKILRRVLRELLENGVNNDFEKEVGIPSTIEDVNTVNVARTRIREYFELSNGKHKALEKAK
ncbi:putative acetate-CoA ligase [Pseudovirgaria hyperparasitica]|uniref:Acetate-CoA ligase n=1 Tax=Pseudovirgaria hyperparasitica TaxID=470096 RepID=A0A6A6WJW9_9PEZI|nr:putative acetate-CoA ligase [Pseudovirgaria hyperparasitica]KAF2761841.1 putative acetate-CoA ligase [Pseudovirgaria hyperparasitica]